MCCRLSGCEWFVIDLSESDEMPTNAHRRVGQVDRVASLNQSDCDDEALRQVNRTTIGLDSFSACKSSYVLMYMAIQYRSPIRPFKMFANSS